MVVPPVGTVVTWIPETAPAGKVFRVVIVALPFQTVQNVWRVYVVHEGADPRNVENLRFSVAIDQLRLSAVDRLADLVAPR